MVCHALKAAVMFGALASAASARTTVSINFGWRFTPDPAGPAHGGNAHGPAVNSTAPAWNATFAQVSCKPCKQWEVIDIPHDASVTGDYASAENGGEGFLPLARTWYRKEFTAPVSNAPLCRTASIPQDGSRYLQ